MNDFISFYLFVSISIKTGHCNCDVHRESVKKPNERGGAETQRLGHSLPRIILSISGADWAADYPRLISESELRGRIKHTLELMPQNATCIDFHFIYIHIQSEVAFYPKYLK